MVIDVIVVLRITYIKNVKFKISKQGQVVIMWDTFITAKPKLGHTKPSTGPHATHGLDIAALHRYCVYGMYRIFCIMPMPLVSQQHPFNCTYMQQCSKMCSSKHCS